MIDTIGGPTKVNNFLATLNIRTINEKNLKKMERRAGQHVESFADSSMNKSALEAFDQEMRYVQIIMETKVGTWVTYYVIFIMTQDHDLDL